MKYRADPYRASILILVLAPILISFTSPKTYQTAAYTPSLYDYDFEELSLDSCIQSIAQTDCLAVTFAPSAEESRKAKVHLKLKNASPMRALNILLTSQSLKYEYLDFKTLIIFQGSMPESVKPIDLVYQNSSLVTLINQVAQYGRFTAELVDGRYKHAQITTEVRGSSLVRAFEVALQSQGLTYQRVACNTIIVFRDESLLLK